MVDLKAEELKWGEVQFGWFFWGGVPTLHSLWDLSSPTRDQTWTLGSKIAES